LEREAALPAKLTAEAPRQLGRCSRASRVPQALLELQPEMMKASPFETAKAWAPTEQAQVLRTQETTGSPGCQQCPSQANPHH